MKKNLIINQIEDNQPNQSHSSSKTLNMNTQEKTKDINELHFEHQLWTRELKFYKDELAIFNKRLAEVESMYTDKEILARSKGFQNQLTLQNNLADGLLLDLIGHEQFLADTAKESVVSINRRVFSDHPELRDRMDNFVRKYRELRNEYMRYLSSVM